MWWMYFENAVREKRRRVSVAWIHLTYSHNNLAVETFQTKTKLDFFCFVQIVSIKYPVKWINPAPKQGKN